MKKYIIVCTLALFLIMPLIGVSGEFSTKSPEIIGSSATLESTHTVLIEYVGQTTCGYCPTASNQLSSIYAAGDLDFYYVSMMVDVNRRVYPRVQELGVTGTPDVYFDGGYRNINGAQGDEQPYRNAIIQSGEREVPDVDIDVDVQLMGGGTLKIFVTITNNEAEEYNGHLRVYIVEPEARWEYVGGGDIHYGVLDIPIDKSLAMPQGTIKSLGDTYTFKKTWFGFLHGFGDITQDNIMVIAAVFDKNTDHSVQTASAEPTVASYDLFQFISSRPMMVLLKLMRGQGVLSSLLNLI
ncbi:MAG: hypothetical protein JSW06_06045 [Thermoplasmatales archaeon]|nr:MAG: hypothetical protein JSW06_06045 [Thermoplasmatales archaeon]